MSEVDPTDIDVTGIPQNELLAALYNRSVQQGMGFLHDRGANGMTPEQAQKELDEATERYNGEKYFDYLHGRVMKVGIDGKKLRTRLFDRDVGYGAAAKVVAEMRKRFPAV